MAGAAREQPSLKIERLKKRPDFLACAQGPACARGAVLVQARARGDEDATVRAGLRMLRGL